MDKLFPQQALSNSLMSSPEPVRTRIWKEFILLTKPGLIRANLLAAFTGFWVAAQWDIPWLTLLWMIVGTAFAMSASCVFNNYFDRDFDRKMDRTRNRILPTGRLKPHVVLWYAIILGITGLLILFLFTNALTAICAALGMFVYVVIYTLWLKPTSTWSTSVGAIAGAMPPVIGYTSVTGYIDGGAVLLFMLLFLWQPPHFWALGIRRVEEYRAAGYPLLPVVKGIKRTKWQMLLYVILLLPITWLFSIYNYMSWIYGITGTFLNIIWLYICIMGFKAKDNETWAKRNFLFSISWLMLHLLFLILDTIRKI